MENMVEILEGGDFVTQPDFTIRFTLMSNKTKEDWVEYLCKNEVFFQPGIKEKVLSFDFDSVLGKPIKIIAADGAPLTPFEERTFPCCLLSKLQKRFKINGANPAVIILILGLVEQNRDLLGRFEHFLVLQEKEFTKKSDDVPGWIDEYYFLVCEEKGKVVIDYYYSEAVDGAFTYRTYMYIMQE